MKFVLSLAVAAFVMSAVPAGAKDYPAEWFACEKNNECTTTYNCGQYAVNKKFAQQYNPVPACVSVPAPDPRLVAQCTDGKCVLATKPEWFACKKDDECTMAINGCMNIAVNKNHANLFEEGSCSAMAAPGTARCTNGQCTEAQ